MITYKKIKKFNNILKLTYASSLKYFQKNVAILIFHS